MHQVADFADLDLCDAFDFAIMMEEDAQIRYEQFARRLGDDPGGANEIFRTMAATERGHARALQARRSALFRDAPPRFEISIMGEREGAELPDVGDELPKTALGALQVALAAEQGARQFYGQLFPRIADPEVRDFFKDLMQQEVEHAAVLARRIAQEPAGTAAAAPPSRATAFPAAAGIETYPDRDLLRTVIPRFDAATQAIATAVLATGLDPGDVAAALGVMRWTVARKLEQFLGIARRILAGSLVTVALMGAPGSLPAAHSVPQPSATAIMEQRTVGEDWDSSGYQAGENPGARTLAQPEAKAAPGLPERVVSHVNGRMQGHDPEVCTRVAQTVLAESALAGLDPLLVLALIDVESTFNPNAKSNHGAVGLMQLKKRTMNDVLKRSGLPSADPRDPVANVQAGVRYLGQLLAAFPTLDTALMAYNAGPTRIRSHLRQGEIPNRYHSYPRKVRVEIAKLKVALGHDAPGGLITAALATPPES